jgi:hypothetical protein
MEYIGGEAEPTSQTHQKTKTGTPKFHVARSNPIAATGCQSLCARFSRSRAGEKEAAE